MDHLQHFDILIVWIMIRKKLEIAEDKIFPCNNDYPGHTRYTGVIWDFYEIFQHRYQEVA